MTGVPPAMMVALAMTVAALTAYISGRVHEWWRQDPARRTAYCKGYDRASAAVLAMLPNGHDDIGGYARPPRADAPHRPMRPFPKRTGDCAAMTVSGSHLVQLLLALGLVVPSSYVAGRVHQWYSHSLRRDAAFRQGYDDASQSMFSLATQQRPRAPAINVPSFVVEQPVRRTAALTRRLPGRLPPPVSADDATRRLSAETTRIRSKARSKATRRHSRRRESLPE